MHTTDQKHKGSRFSPQNWQSKKQIKIRTHSWDSIWGHIFCSKWALLYYKNTLNERLPLIFGRLFGRNNRKGGTASLRSRTCVKRNVAFGARFEGLSLYFLHQNGKLIRIKTGLDTHLIRIQTRTPLRRYPPYDYSNLGTYEQFPAYNSGTIVGGS